MTTPTRKLWDKGEAIDARVHRFTVGDDPQWDAHLVHWDCIGSAAHALTLHRAALLSDDELRRLLSGLKAIDQRAAAGEFPIPPELEDVHTAIETTLTQSLGDIGRKIHAGRSRNDQVVTATRLFMRYHAIGWARQLIAFVDTAIARVEECGDTPMPGYTHMQPAMPSSVGQWLAAQAEAALEQVRATFDLLHRLDCCPLGTGAGFGVPLPLDRAFTAAQLGFSRVQRSAIDVQNSRGRIERYFVRVGADIGTLIEKMSWDLILFSSAEFAFFSLSKEMTTGSSIMPQKQNPDVLELLRAHGGRLRARVVELDSITCKLPMSYHRDLQLTKEPTVRTGPEVSDLLEIATRLLASITMNRHNLAAAMRPELYATDAACDLVRQGVPFRDAYQRVAREIQAGRFEPPDTEQIHRRLADENATWLAAAKAEREELAAALSQRQEYIASAESRLLGESP